MILLFLCVKIKLLFVIKKIFYTFAFSKNNTTMTAKALEKIRDVIDYIAFVITEFSLINKISMKESFDYLNQYGGVAFLEKNYAYEHTENPVYTLEKMQRICQRNGGTL